MNKKQLGVHGMRNFLHNRCWKESTSTLHQAMLRLVSDITDSMLLLITCSPDALRYHFIIQPRIEG